MEHNQDQNHQNQLDTSTNESSKEIEEECRHFLEVVVSYQEYSRFTNLEMYRRKSHLNALKPDHLARLPSKTFKKMEALEGAVLVNQRFLNAVVSSQNGFGPCDIPPFERALQDKIATSAANQSKIRTTLMMCVRDWSSEGAADRELAYGPLIQELEHRLPVHDENRNLQRVLCPGVGLGRLAVEIVGRGYACQGNEFSYQMLLASNFLFNSAQSPNSHAIFPFIEDPNNIIKIKDMLRKVTLPDMTPSQILEDTGKRLEQAGNGAVPDFSMTAGEFLDVYKDQCGCWDAIVTCFFLDTAPVPMDYIEAFERLLRPGGVWINLGPLLYHWASAKGVDMEGDVDERYTKSVELSWEELQHVVKTYGFDIVQQDFKECTYTRDARSMMRTVYDCLFFTAIKPTTAGSPLPPPPEQSNQNA
mmetsp:Transcript_30273/g.39928  ORF Transcript_30273/g.39928 Transcript_30273/m.39928 type:complete len:418 (-) Transcript_30273:175-1428(-)